MTRYKPMRCQMDKVKGWGYLLYVSVANAPTFFEDKQHAISFLNDCMGVGMIVDGATMKPIFVKKSN